MSSEYLDLPDEQFYKLDKEALISIIRSLCTDMKTMMDKID